MTHEPENEPQVSEESVRGTIVSKIAGDALDKAVPHTWSTLSMDELVKFTGVFAKMLAEDIIDRAERYGLGCDAVEELKEVYGIE